MRMHDGELDIDSDLVRRLLDAQFPEMADLPISAVESTGTVNAIYRLGDRLCIRLPRVDEWAQDLLREWEWLPRLAGRLSLVVPKPVAKGEPAGSYPFPWAIYGWIDGQPYADELVADEAAAAADLARFVTELRDVDVPVGAPPGGRRPLRELDAMTRAAIGSAAASSTAMRRSPPGTTRCRHPRGTARRWIHSDLLRPNLLVRDGRLCAVIDFGGIGVGDPAADVIAAWSVFGSPGRARFRAALGVDDGTWNRARGFALHQAAMIIPYYRVTNPGFVALAKRTVEQVLLDHDHS